MYTIVYTLYSSIPIDTVENNQATPCMSIKLLEILRPTQRHYRCVR